MALLNGLGIEAQPALVNSAEGDGLNERLPTPGAFDHVLVRARIGGRTYWLDGTRLGDKRLDDIETPDFSWTLPVQAAGAELARLIVPPRERPATASTLKIDASKGLDVPAAAHAETLFRGDDAVGLNLKLSDLTPAQRDIGLRDYWRKFNSILTPVTVSASFDPVAREERLIMDGTAALAWDPGTPSGRFYSVDGSNLGWTADFTRPAGPHADAPYAVPYPLYDEIHQTVILPNKGQGFFIQGADLDQKAAGRVFVRKSRIEKGVFTMDVSVRSLAPEFPAAEAADAAKALKEMAKVSVYIGAPDNYRMTKEELDQYAAKALTTYDDYTKRGDVMRAQGRPEQARADFEKAVALDPKSSHAYADLAQILAQLGDLGGARDHLRRAFELASGDDYVLRVGVYVSGVDGDFAKSVEYLTQQLAKSPNDKALRLQRARNYQALDDPDKALADTEPLLQADPKDNAVRRLRVDVLLAAGRGEAALAEADAYVAAAAEQTYPHRLRGGALQRLGREAEAQAEFDKALALNKTAAGYAARANDRPLHAYAARMADIAEALKLDPDNAGVLMTRATLEAQLGQLDKAIADIQALVDKAPDDESRRATRAYVYAHAGKPDLAAQDMEWMRGRIQNVAGAWNAICFDEAMWNLTLDKALADCDKAVALSPRSAAILDSRAFVLFRLGRVDEALPVYDLALKLSPLQVDSLYGRGLARLSKGQIKDGLADLAAARRLNARIDDVFAEYGVTPPAAYASSKSATK
jgi:tetratricopeptide (TPR) repeat protein